MTEVEELFKSFTCEICYQHYEKNRIIPVIICINHHIVCNICIKKIVPQSIYCPFCKIRLFYEFHQFKQLFNIKQAVSVIKDRERNLLNKNQEITQLIKNLEKYFNEFQPYQRQQKNQSMIGECQRKITIKYRQLFLEQIKKLFNKKNQPNFILSQRLQTLKQTIKKQNIQIMYLRNSLKCMDQQQTILKQQKMQTKNLLGEIIQSYKCLMKQIPKNKTKIKLFIQQNSVFFLRQSIQKMEDLIQIEPKIILSPRQFKQQQINQKKKPAEKQSFNWKGWIQLKQKSLINRFNDRQKMIN